MNRAMKAQGIECPIVREGDNLVDIVVDSVLNTIARIERRTFVCGYEPDDISEMSYTGFDIKDKDVIGITESVVARTAGQYVTVDEIAEDIEKKFGKDATICLINPIYSRNRFSMILKGIARSAKKVIIVMPEKDEVGNPRGVNKFTGVNIEEYYEKLCESEGCECMVTTPPVFNCNNFIYCGLHDYTKWNDITRFNRIGGINHEKDHMHFTLADICSDKSPDWGLLGTNKATDERLKLFPSVAECKRVCEEVKAKIKEKTDRDVIVCVYGDGCFKDPVGGIWEFADPTTMPYYTDKSFVEGTPSELKLKSLIDSQEPHLMPGHELDDKSIKEAIEINHSGVIKGDSQMGTTPRICRDTLASTMDLISGSGDRATPVVLVQNYF